MKESPSEVDISVELIATREKLYRQFADALRRMDRVDQYGTPANTAYMDSFMLLLANRNRLGALADLLTDIVLPETGLRSALHERMQTAQRGVYEAERTYRNHLAAFNRRYGADNPYNTAVVTCSSWFGRLQVAEEAFVRNQFGGQIPLQTSQPLYVVRSLPELINNARISEQAMGGVGQRVHEGYMRLRGKRKTA